MRRVLLAVASVLLAFLLQNSVLPLIPGLDVLPNLTLVVTVIYGFTCGKKIGMLIGLFCGILSDAFIGDGGLGFYMLAYIYIGAFCGLFTGYIHREEHLFSLLLCTLSSIGFGAYVYVFRFMLRGRFDLMAYLGSTILPELIVTLIGAVILYPAIAETDRYIILTKKRRTSSFV